MIDQEARLSLGIDGGHNIRPELEGHLHNRLGLNYDLRQNGNLHAEVRNVPYRMGITAYHIEDIPVRFKERVINFAMIGRDRLRDLQLGGLEIEEVVPLGLSICSVALEVPKRFRYKRPQDLNGARIATSYRYLTEDFFRRNGAEVEVVPYHGGEESAPAAGVAKAVVAITKSGTAARENGLKVIKPHILESEAVLVAQTDFLREHRNEPVYRWFIDINKEAAVHSEDLMNPKNNGGKGRRRWALPFRRESNTATTDHVAVSTASLVTKFLMMRW